MSVPFSEFELWKIEIGDAITIGGRGLYTHCPVVEISPGTAEIVIAAAVANDLIRHDIRWHEKRTVSFIHGNDLVDCLKPEEKEALAQALGTRVSLAGELEGRLAGIAARAGKYRPGVSTANSYRALRRGRGL